MMDDTQPSRPPANPASFAWHTLRYGGLAGLIGGGWMMAEYALGLQTEHADIGRWTALGLMVIPIATVVLGITSWRNVALGGRIRFAEAFGLALAIGLVFSVTMGALAWLHAGVIAPDLVENQIQHRAAVEAQLPGADPAATARTAEEHLKLATPFLWARFVFSRMLVQSLLVGLIAAVTVPKKRPGLE